MIQFDPLRSTSQLVTGDSAFSMFNLSLREDWANNKTFCHRLTDDDAEEDKGAAAAAEDSKAKVSIADGTTECNF